MNLSSTAWAAPFGGPRPCDILPIIGHQTGGISAGSRL
jgi:hypothetical protein